MTSRSQIRDEDSLVVHIAADDGAKDIIDSLRAQAVAAAQAWGNSGQLDMNDEQQKAYWWGTMALAQMAKDVATIQTALQMIPAEFHSAVQALPPTDPSSPPGAPGGGAPGGPPSPGMPMGEIGPDGGPGHGIPAGPMMPPPAEAPSKPKVNPGGGGLGFASEGEPEPIMRESWGRKPKLMTGQDQLNAVRAILNQKGVNYPDNLIASFMDSLKSPEEIAQEILSVPMQEDMFGQYDPKRMASEGWGEETDYQHLEDNATINNMRPYPNDEGKHYATAEEMMRELLEQGVPIDKAMTLTRQAFARKAAAPPITTPPPADQAGKSAWITQRSMMLQGTGMDAAAAANQAAMEANATTPGTGYGTDPAANAAHGQGTAITPMPMQQPAGYQTTPRVTSITKWADENGAPLQQGGMYQMTSPQYSLPDHVEVLSADPEQLVVNVLQDDGSGYELEIGPEEAAEAQYSFEPMGPAKEHQMAARSRRDDDLPVFKGGVDSGLNWLRDGGGVGIDITAASHLSPREQESYINEPGSARNIEKLNLEGTHYAPLKSKRVRADYSDDDLNDLFSRIDPDADASYVPGDEDDYFLSI